MKTSELVRMVKDVFSVPPGSLLLEQLENEQLDGEIATEDPHQVYYRLGQINLVRRLKSMVAITPEKLDIMIKEENELDDFINDNDDLEIL